jgi:hypothetical protein
MRVVNYIYNSQLHDDDLAQDLWNSSALGAGVTVNWYDVSGGKNVQDEVDAKFGPITLPAFVLSDSSGIVARLPNVTALNYSLERLIDDIDQLGFTSDGESAYRETIRKIKVTPWWGWVGLGFLAVAIIFFIYKIVQNEF